MKILFAILVSVLLIASSLIISYNIQVQAVGIIPSGPGAKSEPTLSTGVIIMATFENGTTKIIQLNSTNIQTFPGVVMILDPTLAGFNDLPIKVVNKDIIKKFITDIDVKIVFEPIDDPKTGCLDGWKLVNGECQPKEIECDDDEIQKDLQCIPKPPSCSSDEQLINNECIPDELPESEEPQGSCPEGNSECPNAPPNPPESEPTDEEREEEREQDEELELELEESEPEPDEENDESNDEPEYDSDE
jgi:hypothetical protein